MTAYKLKENQKVYPYIPISEPASTEHLVLFYTLQALDVYSTYRGVKYDCVYEQNPLLNRKPKIYQMITLKTSILGPVLYNLNNSEKLTNEILLPTTLLTGVVVANNFNVLKDAKQECNKL